VSAPRRLAFKVVGVTFVGGYPQNLYRLQDIAATRYLEAPGSLSNPGQIEPLPVVLIRNPENPHDTNAIEVHVPALGRSGMIGHVPAGIAARLAPSIDAGAAYHSAVVAVLIHPDNPSNPGIEIRLERVADPDHPAASSATNEEQ